MLFAAVTSDDQHRTILALARVVLVAHPGPDDLTGIGRAVEVGLIAIELSQELFDEVLEVIDPRRGEDWRDRDIALSTLDRLVTDQIRINTCPDAGLRQLKQLKYWRDGQWKRYPLRAESSRLPER